MLSHTNLTETLASYAYGLDQVGNRTTLTESLVTVDNLPNGTFLESGGLVVMEGEHGARTNGDTHNWLLQTSVPGYTGTSYLQTSLDIDVLYQTSELTASPRADYLVNITTPETYTVWLRGYPNNAASDSAYVGVDPDGQVVPVTGFDPGQWSWANIKLDSTPATMTITATGLYTVNLWMREDGLRIDRLLLTTDTTFIPTGEGPAESQQIGPGVPPPSTLITRTIVYTYDNLYRLTDADYSTGELFEYEYDAVGNLLKQIIDGDTTDYLYDAANRLEKLNNQAVYSFDDNGNLLNSNTLTNTFDAANRLTSSVRDNGVIVEPIYNGVNDRVGQVTAGVTTTFALDIASGLPEVIYTSEGNAYLHLPGVIVAESSTGETRYLLSDGLGSIRHATNENAQVVAYSEFDPYGNPIQGGNEAYGFTGEWWEDDVGLLHLRARWYAPYLNQFLSPDPIIPNYFNPQSLNQYSYVNNNPINFTDPAGLCPGCAVLQVVAESPGNDYVEDWQRYADKGVTYEMYLRGRRLFKQYAEDGDLYLLDLLIRAGIEPGPVDVASDRLRHASMFAQCYANQNMDIFLPPGAFEPTVDRAFETGDRSKIIQAFMIFITIIGFSDHDDLGGAGRGGGFANPNSINYSQRNVANNAHQYIADMTNGKWDWSRSGPIRVMEVDGQLVSYDNRRLLAAQRAGLDEIPIEIVYPDDIMPGTNRTWRQQFTRRMNDPRNVEDGGVVPMQGLRTQPRIRP